MEHLEKCLTITSERVQLHQKLFICLSVSFGTQAIATHVDSFVIAAYCSGRKTSPRESVIV